jgi:hypothetical protein
MWSRSGRIVSDVVDVVVVLSDTRVSLVKHFDLCVYGSAHVWMWLWMCLCVCLCVCLCIVFVYPLTSLHSWYDIGGLAVVLIGFVLYSYGEIRKEGIEKVGFSYVVEFLLSPRSLSLSLSLSLRCVVGVVCVFLLLLFYACVLACVFACFVCRLTLSELSSSHTPNTFQCSTHTPTHITSHHTHTHTHTHTPQQRVIEEGVADEEVVEFDQNTGEIRGRVRSTSVIEFIGPTGRPQLVHVPHNWPVFNSPRAPSLLREHHERNTSQIRSTYLSRLGVRRDITHYEFA